MIDNDKDSALASDAGRSRWRVFEEVRHRLIAGGYSPGEKIKLRWLAKDLGTSVTPVREALLQLVAAGALVHSHQRSIHVPPANWATYKEIRDLRLFLEGGMAAYAASKITIEEIDQLEEIAALLDTRSPTDPAKHKALIAQFHFGIYGAAGRPVTFKVIEGLWLQTGPYLNYLIPDYLPFSEGTRFRANVCQALRARDAMAAAEAVQTDLRDSLGFVLKKLTAN